MSKTKLVAAMAAILAGVSAASAVHAQTRPVTAWQPAQQQEMDPAKRVPATAPATTAAPQAQSQAQSQAYAPAQANQAQLAGVDSGGRASYEEGLGGFFVGLQGGKGWVYDDVDQKAVMVNAGYRWQAGAVTLVGIEVASGRLGQKDHDGWRYDRVDYASIGANARFSFGAGNPVYGLVRAGYWAADSSVNDGDNRADVDGGYFGVGLGVDLNRHVNMSLTYTNHVYFNDYYWDDGEFYYDANRADTLMLGIEARF